MHAIKEELFSKAGTLHGAVPRPDPMRALVEELWRSASIVAWLEGHVRELKESQLAQLNASGVSVPAFYVAQYERERAAYARTAALCVQSGLAERMVKVTEGQAQQLALVIRMILQDLQLSPEQRARVPDIVRARLQGLPAPGG